MPGLLGFLTKNPRPPDAEQRLSTMLDCMLHESFYTHGVHAVPEMGLYVGWVSQRDSYADCNPIVNAARDVVMLFAGEHFDHASTSDDRRPRPGDARELMALYERKGDSFLLDLNGWFAGVLVDTKRQRAVLFNDRFGMHRIFYAETADALVFASEAKSVLAVVPQCRRLNPTAVGQLLTFGSVFGGATLFTDLQVLPPGSSWQLTRGGASKKTYFDIATWEQQPRRDAPAFYPALKQNLSRILPAYYRAHKNTAISLTGGLDTRIIVAGRPPLETPTPCYTYGGLYRDCYDVRTAAKVAAVAQQPYQVIPLGRDFFDNFAGYAERTVWLTDGYLDICGAHELYFSQRARNISPVRITGNYGSEVLRSHSTFRGGLPSSEVFAADLLPHCQRALATVAELRAGHEVTFSALHEVPCHLYGKLAIAQTQLHVRSPYMDNELVALVYAAPPDVRKTREFSLRLIGDLNPALAPIETDMGYSTEGSQLLAQPRRFYRYLTFKAEWYYNLGMTPELSRVEGLIRPFEPLFLGVHKIDHYRVWFRDYLRNYVRETLSSTATITQPYVRPNAVAKLVDAPRLTGPDVNAINRLITLAIIHKRLVDWSPEPPQRAASEAVAAGAWNG
jgi:asparagine synthase (glutamine-hydrolysing)